MSRWMYCTVIDVNKFYDNFYLIYRDHLYYYYNKPTAEAIFNIITQASWYQSNER